MTSSVFDQSLQQHMWTTEELSAIFSQTNRLQKWYDFEAALAVAQADLSIIPREAAAEIAAKARAELADFDAMAAETRRTQHPVVAAVRALQALCSPNLGEYVHFGATSQDVYDTGLMLQVKEAHAILTRDLQAVGRQLYRLSDAHKRTPMVGRTHSVQALPITFGHKCAIWLSELARHHERLNALEARTFVGQMVGAVGTKASFGPHATELEQKVMQRLGLNVAEISWQPARDRLCEYVGVLGLIGGTLGKIANQILILSSDEVGEVAEPFSLGKVGSSTMPHKRNPATVETVVTLSRAIRYSVAMMHDALFVENERDVAAVRMEWKAVPEACMMTGAMLQMMNSVLGGLTVNAERMLSNLGLLGGFLMSERVMFELARQVGKQTAHDLVYEAAMRGRDRGESFERALREDPRVHDALDERSLKASLDPTTYLGLAPEIVDDLLAQIDRRGWLS